MSDALPRPEYPRPQFERDAWLNLNGTWEFAFDDDRVGEEAGWPSGNVALPLAIQVPFAFESKLSGIGDTRFHDVVWYRRTVKLPDEWAGKRIKLHFGAVDYRADVWVNGRKVVEHEGGHTPFTADITLAVAGGEAVIVVRAEDFGRDMTLPRGKQYWREKSEGIFYTRTTGIWQTVWLEAVDETHLERIRFTPDIDRQQIGIRCFFRGLRAGADIRLNIRIAFKGETVAEETVHVRHNEEYRWIGLYHFHDHGQDRWWWPGRPNLYDVRFTLTVDGVKTDEVASYFGMRKVSIEDGKLCLNNRPYFMRLVLDQGYWPDGVLTAPSDEALVQDVQNTKDMGFNGVRKHQKVEDPRYLYHADRMGLLVWGEAANAPDYSEDYVRRFTKEWTEAVERDYNHPSVVVWVPINESWGIPNVQIDKKQQHHGLAMYHLTRSLDDTRPVVYNDGWEQMTTDLLTIHDYESRREVLAERYSSVERAVNAMPAGRRLFVGGASYEGQPILVSEFGGIAFKRSEWEGWGYSGASTEEEFLEKLAAVVEPLLQSPAVQGFCYTQLTDVEQEINGLLTFDRVSKAPLEKLKSIFGAPRPRF